jgi:hypothetical protein
LADAERRPWMTAGTRHHGRLPAGNRISRRSPGSRDIALASMTRYNDPAGKTLRGSDEPSIVT